MRSSEFQSPNSEEGPGCKFQSPQFVGERRRRGTWNLELGTLLACAACYGRSDSTLAQGMNWGIFTLMGVLLTVLTCITVFFVHIVRKEEAAIKPPEKNLPTDL